VAFSISHAFIVSYCVSLLLRLSSYSFNSIITTNSFIVTLGHVNTPNLVFKMFLCKHSNTGHNDSWMYFANWNVTPNPTMNIFPSSRYDDNGDSNGEIVTNGKMLYISLLIVTPIIFVFVIFSNNLFHIPLIWVFAIVFFLHLNFVLLIIPS
jgi:hypothetical protein